VPVHRAQQRIDFDEGAHIAAGQQIDSLTQRGQMRAAPIPTGGHARN
jgi:hypothetical protein